MSITEAELSAAIEVALYAARAATDIINKSINERLSPILNVNTKSNSTDWVTQYDMQCEEEVLNALLAGTPDYAVISEETQADLPLGDGPTWVVDPIDGTISFAHGLYDCCVSIALVVNKEPILGVISAPRLQEIYTAAKGRGAYCNGQRIHVSNTTTLDDSVVIIHQPYNRSQTCVEAVLNIQREFLRLPVQSVRCYGSAALNMCFVASGKADLYFEVGFNAWDYAAGAIIIREAGGVVHDVDNTNTLNLMGRAMCCGPNKAITLKAIEVMDKYNYRDAVYTVEST
ncbi:unnamed protein product [Phytomonas sp. Hart1]|nr:unnamed protein product [Phytomonas sp. Hart1]|eukprot:CCW69672.1 unnamed protein product [Phytomonas sp. isolate Hart1]